MFAKVCRCFKLILHFFKFWKCVAEISRKSWFWKPMFLLKCWVWNGAEVYKSCRAWKMLPNAYFLAKFRFDTAENEPAKILQNFANRRTPAPPSVQPLSETSAASSPLDGLLKMVRFICLTWKLNWILACGELPSHDGKWKCARSHCKNTRF